jgi:hypothetical protein
MSSAHPTIGIAVPRERAIARHRWRQILMGYRRQPDGSVASLRQPPSRAPARVWPSASCAPVVTWWRASSASITSRILLPIRARTRDKGSPGRKAVRAELGSKVTSKTDEEIAAVVWRPKTAAAAVEKSRAAFACEICQVTLDVLRRWSRGQNSSLRPYLRQGSKPDGGDANSASVQESPAPQGSRPAPP